MKLTLMTISFVTVLTVMSGRYIFVNSAPENSTMGVSHNLACPCECPMVLEDCHMSCGLRWKDQIGAKLKVGLKQDNINAYFYKRYGKEAMLTPAQRFAGKWYQVSRGGYPVKDMLLFGTIVIVWTSLVYTMLVMAREKFALMRGKKS